MPYTGIKRQSCHHLKRGFNTMIKVNTALQTVASYETETEGRLLNAINEVYVPLFKVGIDRASYRKQQKGVKHNTDMYKAWDREKGIRDENDDFIIPKGLRMKAKDKNKAMTTYWSNVEKLAHMHAVKNKDGKTELEIVIARVGGETIATVCKNLSQEDASLRSTKSRKGAGKNGKAGKDEKETISKPSKGDTNNPFLKALNTMIAECPEMDSAQYARMIVKLMPIAQKQFPNVEGKAVMAFLENPAMLKKTG